MDEDFVEADEGAVCPPGRWRWTVLPLYSLTFVANVCADAGTYFANIAQEVAGHYNYQSEREQFAAEAGRELETILETPGDE
jgi:hypothetical protein